MTNWPEIARCFAVLRPGEWIDPRARDFLRGLSPSRPVIIACSGGADSVFLTLVLCSLLPPDRIRVAHFNHGIRGESADDDERFVSGMCTGIGLRFYSGRPVSPLSKDEASLRAARYEWLESLYAREGAGALALGHHADDLLESQLMSVFAGTGPSGMASPEPVRTFSNGHVRLRPLLPVKRSTIETTLKSLEIVWQEDPSNKDSSYTRNWIRSELLPLIKERIPQDTHAAAQRTRLMMAEAVEVIDSVLMELGIDTSDPAEMDVRLLIHRPAGLIRRALMGWWLRHFPGRQLPGATMDEVIELIHSGRARIPVSIGVLPALGAERQAFELSREGRLCLRPENTISGVDWPAGSHWQWRAGELFLPDGAVLAGQSVHWQSGEAPFLDRDPSAEAWLCGVNGPLVVRQWQPGDRYQPLGAPGRRKLQDLFTDAKLTTEQKRGLPVILSMKGEILWIPGFPPAEGAKGSSTSKSALRLTYREHFTAFPPHHVG